MIRWLLALMALPLPGHMAEGAPLPARAEALAAPAEADELAELDRFPPSWLAEKCYRFADAHADWLEGQATLGEYERRQLAGSLIEARRRAYCWYRLHLAQHYRQFPGWRRDALNFAAELRGLLGEDDWRDGRMPPPVLVGTFRRID